jgi:HK97 family phage major capsid protein
MKVNNAITSKPKAIIGGVSAHYGGPGAGMAQEVNAKLEKVTEQYSEISADVKEVFSALKEHGEGNASIGARLNALEQHVVGLGDGFSGNAHTTSGNVAAGVVEALKESSAFSSLAEWNHGTARVKVSSSVRAIVNDGKGDSSTGVVPNNPERSGIYGPVARPLTLLEILPSRPTERDSVEHVRLNVDGDVAIQEKEGDEKAELDFDGTLIKAPIVTIAGHTTASKQVLADHAALQSQIDLVISNKLVAKLEDRIINGNGGNDIDGLLSLSTLMVPAIGSTPADLIGEAVTRMQQAGYQPSAIILNPSDWFAISITKTEQEGSYLFGSPVAAVPLVLWRVPVVLTPSITAGTALVIDTQHITVLDREEPSVMLSNSHKDYFTRNLVAVLGELRAGLEVRDEFAIYRVNLTAEPASE